MSAAIWWIRRDLRLNDNGALSMALAKHDAVFPVFVLDDRLLNSRGASQKRLRFMLAGLRTLQNDVARAGGDLVVRRGSPEDVLPCLMQETGAVQLFAERHYSPFAKVRDAAVAERLPMALVDGQSALPADAVVKDDGQPYTVYTPFSRKWKQLWEDNPVQPKRYTLAFAASSGLRSDPVDGVVEDVSDSLFEAGEDAAKKQLDHFTSEHGPVYRYADERNRPDLDSTSKLSAYLRFGMLSAADAVRRAYAAIDNATDDAARASAQTWLNELIWREFFISIQLHFPHVHHKSFRDQYDHIEWANDAEAFEAWRMGRTGYPIVDAGMRQLSHTGWMHNRVRMITASFLVKDLLIDWRWGERWFMQHLIDGDPASNNGGWQWVAGTGTDAAPYFRIFNPVSQAKKFDPDGEYVRRWVPELGCVPNEYIHMPWEMTPLDQAAHGCLVGKDYPARIVDHAWARERALAAFGSVSGAG